MFPRRFIPSLIAGCVLLGALAPIGEAANKLKPLVRCSDNKNLARPLKIPVGDATATGHYAVPSARAPQGLVVFAHGYGHTSYSWMEHMRRVADELGVITVGMDMAVALAEANVSTDLFTVARKDEDSERETTITGYAMDNADPNWRSPLAGHASETSTTHIVMTTAFARLALLMSKPFDLPFGYREFLVDGELGTRRII